MTRYFKIVAPHQLHASIKEATEKIKEEERQIFDFGKSLGATEVSMWDYYVSVRITGFQLRECPDGWRKTKRYGFFYPKAIKKNKTLLNQIAELPKVNRKALFSLLNVDGRYGHPGICVRGDHVLIETDDESFEPLEGMIEILGSEYNALDKASTN